MTARRQVLRLGTLAAGAPLVASLAPAGPEKSQVIARTADGSLDAPAGLVPDAHAAGLTVIPYTFRAENQFLPAGLRVGADPAGWGRAVDEQLAFLRAGVDGVFTDHPDIAVLARSALAGARS